MTMVSVSIIEHIASHVAPGTQLLDWYEPVDFTDLDMAPVVGQVWLEGMALDRAVDGSAVAYLALYSFTVNIDIPRASVAQKAAAQQLLLDATRAIVGFEYAPAQYPTMRSGSETTWDGRVMRLSVGFSLPWHVSV